MPTFTFTARDETGNSFSSTLEGPDKKTVRDDLRRMRYEVKCLKQVRGAGERAKNGKIHRSDVIVFTRQLATMCGAGVAFFQALGLLAEETQNLKMREVIKDVQTQIGAGASLRDACARHPEVFSEFFLGMIESAETGGTLNQVLDQVADHLERQEELKQKIVQAFAYPVIVVVLCCLVVTFLVLFIVPVFADAYKKLGVELPGPTQTLIGLSNFMRDYWWGLLAGIAAAAFFWIRFRRTEAAMRTIGVLKEKTPVFGPLNRKIAVCRFLKNFAIMLNSGIPVQQSVTIAEGIAKSPVISTAAAMIRDGVNAGKSILEPLRESGVFPPMVTGMAAAGESSGAMPEMFARSAEYLEKDVERSLKKMLVKLEPVLTVGLAAVVGFILLAVYLPMFDVMKTAR